MGSSLSDEQVLIEPIRLSVIDGLPYKYGNFKDPNGNLVQIGVLVETEEFVLRALTIQDVAIQSNVVYARFINLDGHIIAHSDESLIGLEIHDQELLRGIETISPGTIKHYHELEGVDS